MPRVAVTGSSGKLGRAVVADLRDHGWDVIALDRSTAAPQPAPDGSVTPPTTVVDLADFGQTLEALTGVEDRYDGVDALVHLAAVPAPGLRTNSATFANNMATSYNVLQPRRIRAGIRNVVWASSETVLGLPFDEFAALRAGRRGVPTASQQHLLAGEDTGGGDGPAVLPLGIRTSSSSACASPT